MVYIRYVLCILLHFAESSKILGVFPHFGRSHFLVFEPLMVELARRGHEVTVVSRFPRQVPLENYKDVALPPPFNPHGFIKMENFENQTMDPFIVLKMLRNSRHFINDVANTQEVKSIENLKFDLSIIELFNSEVLLGTLYKIGAPIIGITSCDVFPWHNELFARPDPPSVVPVTFTSHSDAMTFSERLHNFFVYHYSKIYYELFMVSEDRKLAYFEGPDLASIAKNISLFLTNTHFSMFRSRLYPPSVVEIGGINVKEPKSLPKLSSSAKVLGVFPHFGKSHFLVFEPLLDELARRGHDVTVMSFFPKKTPMKNYHDISIPDLKISTGFLEMGSFENKTMTPMENLKLLKEYREWTKDLVKAKEVRLLENTKFDVSIIELFNSEVLLGTLYKIGAPIIGITSCEVYPWHNEWFDRVDTPSVVPFPMGFLSLTDQMNIYDRLLNIWTYHTSRMFFDFVLLAGDRKLAKEYIGDVPDLKEIGKNMSLLLTNTHFSIFRSRVFPPSVIEIGGINVKEPKQLNQDLKKIMDESQGVIYFSMGSVLKGDSLHDKKQQAFIKVFSELKQTVLWKRESPLSVNVKNIVTNGWYPQRDILAHPKVELFITHFGLLGTNEAVSSGVPMVGIPMFGDQHHNGKALESIGVAVSLDFNELNEDNIREAINKVLRNPSYKENARKMKEAYLDRPMSPLDTAVYWVEYVIRHKGAPHLKSAARHLTWYQYHNLDVYALLLFIIYVSYLILKFTIKSLCALCCKTKKLKTQ